VLARRVVWADWRTCCEGWRMGKDVCGRGVELEFGKLNARWNLAGG
jgi:hypothetical protein